MSQVTACKIPSELIDAVIDLIHDKQSLTACSVVCKAWLPRSRYHLFDRVHISPDSFIRWFDPAFGSPLPIITPYVRTLLLHDEKRTASRICPKASNDMLSRLLVFSALESLYIIGRGIFEDAEEDVRNRFLSGFIFLRALRIRHVRFWTSTQMVAILGACTDFEIISLDFVFSGLNIANTLPTPNFQSVPSRLRILQLNIWDKSIVLDWLLSAPTVPPVEVLCLKNVGAGEMPSIGNFLRALGSSLRRLELSFAVAGTGDIEKAFSYHVTLANNLQLRSIYFTNLMVHSDYHRIAYVGWVPIILSQITSPHIEEVVMRLLLTTIKNIDLFDWGAMAGVLGQPHFSRLKRLQFEIRGEVNRDELAIAIRERLPECDGRGILYVSECDRMT